MSNVRVAINGFGRIGRLAFRQMFGAEGYEVVAINDLTSPKMLANLLKYDTAQGGYAGVIGEGLHTVSSKEPVFEEDGKTVKVPGSITVDGKEITIYAQPKANLLPWGELNVDVVLECTGFYCSKEKSMAHIEAGAKKVVISAPAGKDLKTIVFSVNEKTLTAEDQVISAASCTTNCLAPMRKALNDKFGVIGGTRTTVHAYTNDQRILDLAGSNIRRSRAGAANIVPTTTGAAKAVGKVIPELNGRLNGNAIRVPVTDGSICDCTLLLKKPATVEEINAAEKEAAEGELKGVLGYNEDQIVSSDILGRTEGSIFDATLTRLIPAGDYTFVKVASWYDNEYSFTCQMRRLAKLYGEILSK